MTGISRYLLSIVSGFFKRSFNMLIPVVLAGGVGSRLWPASRKLLPKQLQTFDGDRTMLQSTLDRVVGINQLGAPIVICNDEHRFLVEAQLAESASQFEAGGQIVLESVARNTAPAVAAAAVLAKSPDDLLLVMPADHFVRDQKAFQQSIATGVQEASTGRIVTFGVQPTAPHTGYGYIRRKPGSVDAVSSEVAEFVEKPDLALAEQYLQSGDYFWNSGIFLFRADVFLQELKEFEPEISASVHDAVETAETDLGFLRLGADAFARAPAISIDYAVMEKTKLATVVPVNFGWSDVGSWQGLWDALDHDSDENVLQGDVVTHDVGGSIVRSTHRTVAVLGVDDVVVVDTADALLVASRERSEDVKTVVSKLEEHNAELTRVHKKVYRPWGSFESLGTDDLFQVKRLTLKPGARISLQRHQHRAEHWVVVAGTAKVVRGEEEIVLKENESTFIPVGTKHMLENIGGDLLEIIEVQTGSYFGEDDIERFEDVYGRVDEKP